MINLKLLNISISILFFFFCSLANLCTTYSQDNIIHNKNNKEEDIKLLKNLTQYEIDHSFLIRQCIDNIRNQALKDRLLKMREECGSNIQELSSLITKYGGEKLDYSKDFKGFFMQGYAAMRGLTSDQGAMSALHTNSKIILKSYESALNYALPEDIKQTVRKIYESKKSWLEYIESKI
jgi:uncharacterized protein (TIGR02284 family)